MKLCICFCTSTDNQLFNYFKMHLQIRRLISKIHSLTNLESSPTLLCLGLEQLMELVLLFADPNPHWVPPLPWSPMEHETHGFLLSDNLLSYSLNDGFVSEVSAWGVQPNINVMDFTNAVEKTFS
uniref:Uncharacterized protein n=1 Tax=Opuntia streptacantha TaxID=393608 RepID=A0A7C9D9D4_OPUST